MKQNLDWKTLLGLILCNMVWSLNPSMAKLVLRDFTAPQTAWLRYFSAFLAFGIAVVLGRGLGRRPEFRKPFFRPRDFIEWFWLTVMGIMAFCFTPLTQMWGLSSARATDSAVITAIEPLITVVMAWLILGEKPGASNLLGFVFALIGFSMLSDLSWSSLGSSSFSGVALGNGLIFLSLVGEASYSVFGRKLMNRHSPVAVFGTSLLLGVTILSIVISWAGFLLPAFPSQWPRWSTTSFFAVLWMGPLGTLVSYLFWMFVIGRVPVSTVVLTLFVQPVCGALWGRLLLGDRLTAIQMLGSVVIVCSVFVGAFAGSLFKREDLGFVGWIKRRINATRK